MALIPPHAKAVFKGVIFTVYQWEQTMFDGSVKTFERLKRNDSTAVLAITREGNVIVEYQEQPALPPFISTPGGICDEGEDPLVCAQRELFEETGYVSKDWELWYAHTPFQKIAWTSYTYIARNCVRQQSINPDLAGEKITVQEVAWSEFLRISEREDFRDRELCRRLLLMRVYPEKLKEFEEKIFKKTA